MQTQQIDRLIARAIFGQPKPDFTPSQSERDAWTVVSWMQAQSLPIDIHHMAPQQLCSQCLQYLRSSKKNRLISA